MTDDNDDKVVRLAEWLRSHQKRGESVQKFDTRIEREVLEQMDPEEWNENGMAEFFGANQSMEELVAENMAIFAGQSTRCGSLVRPKDCCRGSRRSRAASQRIS